MLFRSRENAKNFLERNGEVRTAIDARVRELLFADKESSAAGS